MSANSLSRRRNSRRDRRGGLSFLLLWLDVFAIAGWGALFLKYWFNGKLFLLIHPNYMGLTIAGGIGLLVISILRALNLLGFNQDRNGTGLQHMTLFPPGWGSVLLIVTAIAGFVIEPRAFASPMAIHRGITDSIAMTRSRPQTFRSNTKPEDRSLVEWVRTLNVNPEPDAYTGDKVKVQGFVIHPPSNQMSEQYLIIARFVLTCCAADAYPIGLPVKLKENRSAYSPDKWFEVEGQMITDMLGGKRQLTIAATSLKPIPEPKNPYDY